MSKPVKKQLTDFTLEGAMNGVVLQAKVNVIMKAILRIDPSQKELIAKDLHKETEALLSEVRKSYPDLFSRLPDPLPFQEDEH